MQIDDPATVDGLPFLEIDELRHQLRLTKAEVCDRAGINESTYQRWLRWARGDDGGSRPHARSLKAVREVLKVEIEGRGSTLRVEHRPAA